MLFLYSTSVFVSAFLVFLVQPMVGKMLLPWVGGAPAVWNTCMFFFQLLLLGGYFYTHLAFKSLTARRQMLLHIVLMCGAWLSLPISFAPGSALPEDPALWILRQLFVAVALPFLFLSSTAPMLQKWFSLSNHPRAANPFFLYAASNAGSLSSLIVYPVLLEPYFTLQQQSAIWAWSFAALNLLLLLCALMLRSNTSTPQTSSEIPAAAEAPARKTCLLWLLASAVPSSMFLATTHFLTRDIAPVPFLWVVPLAIYLLTYIIAFSDWFKISSDILDKSAILALAVFLPVYYLDGKFEIWLALPAHLYVLFSFSLLCHRFLAETKPSAEHLTLFYLILAVGGVTGGFFNSMVAPLIFVTVAEYPLSILLGTIFLGRYKIEPQSEKPDEPAGSSPNSSSSLLTAILGGVQIAALIWVIIDIPTQKWVKNLAVYFSYELSSGKIARLLEFLADHEMSAKLMTCVGLTMVSLILFQRQTRFKFVVCTAVVMLLLFVARIGLKNPVLYQSRNFFGGKEVISSHRGTLNELAHGNTIHGAQSLLPLLKKEPLVYYHRLGPAGDIFALPAAAKPNARVAILGLGPGNAAAYGKPGQKFTFFEIDPEIIFIARDTGAFTFLSDSQAECSVVSGDARLAMAQQPADSFDLIIIAAFSSDSIPVHLITVEAMQIYLEKLSHDGVIAVNISNRYLDLIPLIGALAETCGLSSAFFSDHSFDDAAPENYQRSPSLYALLSRSSANLPVEGQPFRHRWQPCPIKEGAPAWTDNFSSLLPFLCLDMTHSTAFKGFSGKEENGD